ncbi:unnamed protein product, partial [Owenia fusiformis]
TDNGRKMYQTETSIGARVGAKEKNISIHINEDVIQVDTQTLYKASPYFNSLLRGGFCESSQSAINLTGSFRSIDELVNLLTYTNQGNLEITDDTLEDVLHDATFLMIDSLRTRCEKFMIFNLALDNCLHYLALSTLYDVKTVQMISHAIVRSRFRDSIQYGEEVLSVPFDFLSILIQQNVMKFCKLGSKRELLTRWVMHNPREREYLYFDLVHLAGLSIGFADISVVFPYRLVLPTVTTGWMKHIDSLQNERTGRTHTEISLDNILGNSTICGEREVVCIASNERCVVFDEETDRWHTIPQCYTSNITFSGNLTNNLVVHVDNNGNIIVENMAKRKCVRILKRHDVSFMPTTYFCHGGNLYGIGGHRTKKPENWVNKVFDPVYGLHIVCTLKRFDMRLGTWTSCGTIPGAPALCTIRHTIDKDNDAVYMLASRMTSAYLTDSPSFTFHSFNLQTQIGKQLRSPEMVDIKSTHLLQSQDSGVFLVDLERHTIQQYNSVCDAWKLFAYLPKIVEHTAQEVLSLSEDSMHVRGHRQIVSSSDTLYVLSSSHPLVSSFHRLAVGECSWTELPPPPLNIHAASHVTTLLLEGHIIEDLPLSRFED